MSFGVEVCAPDRYPRWAAEHITARLPARGALVITGGTTAEKIYRELPGAGGDYSALEVFFSDERCVPPENAASNYGMAKRLLFDPLGMEQVHRMQGELEPLDAARAYAEEITPAVAAGIDLVLLGMGADAHIGAMFPGSGAVAETRRLCVAVDRPDGMTGLTLTPPALLSGSKILVPVAGADKSEAVHRVVTGSEPPAACPARVLAEHPDVTFLLDEHAASRL